MTLLIKNVRVLGGARDFPQPVDIFVSDDTIAAIGTFPNKSADEVVDGQGAYASPGFIDVNTDSDHYLTIFDYPSQQDFLRQGVTTIFGGTCGSSLAPLIYGSLESFQKWGDTDRVNVNWHTMKEFLAVMDYRPLAVNFGTLVGHSTIRRALIGDTLRELTKNEINVFSAVLKNALAEGGFGLSVGLGYVHARNAPFSELKTFANIVKTFGGVCTMHLRDGAGGVKASVDETIKLAKETGVSTIINHLVPILGAEKDYEAATAEIAALPPEVRLRFDLYPSSRLLLPLYTFLPVWAQTGGVEAMLKNVNDPWLQPRIQKEMPRFDEEHFIIARATNNDFLVGKSLAEVRHMYGVKDGREALLRLMVTMRLKGGVLYRNVNEQLAVKTLANPRSLVASNAPSFEYGGGRGARGKQVKSERTTSTFAKFLKLIFEERLLPPEEGIRKITSEPARIFGLARRGEIKEGNIADLAVFTENEVKCTVVNGRVAMKGGEFQDRFSGKILRRAPGRSA